MIASWVGFWAREQKEKGKASHIAPDQTYF